MQGLPFSNPGARLGRLLGLLLLGVCACQSSSEPDLCGETPSGAVKLPADDAAHGAPVEWWYWTGHLQAQDGRWFGFEQVFFAIDGSEKGQMAQSALTDVSGATFHHTVALDFDLPKPTTNGFDLSLDGQSASGDDGDDTLHVTPAGATLDLTLTPEKAPVLHYGTGYETFPNGNTYYYSRERSAATGTLSLGGEKLPVTGQAWFDHQWGDLSRIIADGWQWMALQLDDHTDIMLNQPLQNGAPSPAVGTISDDACNDTRILAGDVQVTSLGTWKSPHTGCTYPMGWHVVDRGRDLDLTIEPVLEDQELYDSMPKYWEGACTISGSATGRGYVELVGFCP